MLMHGNTPVREVVIHTSATPAGWWIGKTANQMRDEIRRWHTAPPNNWRDIGYHYVIAPNGDIATGRSETEVGAHVKGRNTGTLGICLVPIAWVDRVGSFEDWYTPEQKIALRRLLRQIAGRTNLTTISGHNQFSKKLCPGFDVPGTGWLSVQAITSGTGGHTYPKADYADGPTDRPHTVGEMLAKLIAALFRRG